jgi:AraC family transcriptional regulator
MYYDDPGCVPEEDLRSRAGATVDEDQALEAPLEEARIPGGPHAVLVHKGPYSELHAAYHWLYKDWLVNSGREPADAPVFEEYLNNPHEVAPSELLTVIRLPLK